ncbi:MAG: alpha/beta fold hydrolase, partial [Anaerolineae bacterium]
MSSNAGSILKTVGLILGIGLLLGLLIPLILLIVQDLGLSQARANHAPPGSRVDVDGLRLHLACEGPTSSSAPTVVIDADVGAFSLDWSGLQADLADALRVCVYDRAGYGWSGPSDEPRNALQVADELHALLAASEETGPYVLVGHGLGALHAELYAGRYPDQVAGLVLIDPTTDFALSPPGAQRIGRVLSTYETMGRLAATGALRFLQVIAPAAVVPPRVAGLETRAQAPYRAWLLDPTYYETAIAELEQLGVSLDQAADALWGDLPLGHLPLIVLTPARTQPLDAGPYSDETISMHPDRAAAQGRLTALSNRSERRNLGRSGPNVMLDAPEAVRAAIRDVVGMVE